MNQSSQTNKIKLKSFFSKKFFSTPPLYIFSTFFLFIKYKKNHYKLLIVFSYIGVSLFILPYFQKSDFLFFFNWKLFNLKPAHFVFDIGCGEKEDLFLFRDYSKINLDLSRKSRQALFYLIQKKSSRIKNYQEDIKALCQFGSPYLIKLKGSLYEHIILKKDLEVITKMKLDQVY